MKWGFISLCLVICIEAQLNLGQNSQPVSGLVEAQLDESQPRGRRIVRAPQHPEHPRATQRQKGSQRPQRPRQTQRRKALPKPTLRTRHAQRAHALQRAQHAQRTSRTQHVQGSLRSLSAQRAHHAQRSQRVQRAQNSQRTTPQRPQRPQRARHQRPQSAQRAQSPQRSKLQQRPQRQRAHVPKRPQSPKHTQRTQRPKRPQSPRRPTQRPQRQPNKQKNRGNRPRQNRNKNGGARRAKRSKKVDVVKDLKLMQKGPRPSRKVWRRKVRRFCRRFPGHPKCRRGRMPKYSELGSMLQLLKGKKSRLLPRVPRMRIRDPLARVDRKLARELARFKIKLGKVDEPTARKLRDRCRRFKCKEKKKEHIEEKELVAAKILEFEQSQFGEEKDTREEIELRLDRTQQLKETLLEKANLSDVVDPADNGVFDSDLLLTADQANFLLNDLGKAGEGADEIPLPTDFDDDDDETPAERRKRENRRKRAALFFEENVVKKWDMNAPIQYYLDNSLSTQDKNDVRGAVSDIQRSSCIRFQEVRSAPTGYHIHYYKVNSPTLLAE